MTHSSDVKYSALNADLHCGEGTEQVLYLEPGTLLSRRVTSTDLYEPDEGSALLVMYTAARRSDPWHRRYAGAAQRLLELNVPSFTFGTDLVLPISANEDLRTTLLFRDAGHGEGYGASYGMEDDWEQDVHYWSHDVERALAVLSGREDMFLPQVWFFSFFPRGGG